MDHLRDPVAVSRRVDLPDREPRRDGGQEHPADAATASSDRRLHPVRRRSGGAAAEIEKAKGLLDSGAITQAEFDSIKAEGAGRRLARRRSGGAPQAPLRSPPPSARRVRLVRCPTSHSRRRPRGRSDAAQDPPDRGVDRRDAPRPRCAPARRDRRLGLVRGAVGHAHRDLDRLHHPGLLLPGPADGAHGARLVRNPALRVSGRRHVHARARGVRDRRRAQQLRAREHGHVRDAPHVRRDRQGRDVPGRARRLRRTEDLLLHHRHAHLHLPLQRSRRLVRLPVRQRVGRAHRITPSSSSGSPQARSSSSPSFSDSSGPGSRRCGRRRCRARRSSATSART